jgi:hypothetical protein
MIAVISLERLFLAIREETPFSPALGYMLNLGPVVIPHVKWSE